MLTARDIFRARKVPRLVFDNACFSGVLREGRAFAEDELTRGLATIAQALTMAEQFYMALVQRRSIGDALYQARKAIFDQQIESTWGAYQHYGDPDDTLLRPPG